MKKTLSLLLAVCLFLSAAAVLVGVTAAWLADGLYTQRFPTDFSGSSALAYFAGGNGTAADPYEINSAVHLYNLAWLQYLGYFNMNPALNNGLAQSHFRLTGNIEMGALILPPIGTTEYPFIGAFDGNGYTVSGLTVSNREQDLHTRPVDARFNDNAHLRCVDTTDAVSIVGLFGVIGNPKGTTYVDTYAAANPGFAKDTVAVGGFYADNLHIRSYTESTLCGLIAGWVGANLSRVGVYRGDFVFAANAAGLAAFLDDGDSGTLLSKYSLVGNYDKDLVGWSVLPGSGDNTGWGGSVDMEAVHKRLVSFWQETPKKYVDASFNNATSGIVRYYHEDKGSFYYRSSTADGMVYLLGGLQSAVYRDTETTETGFFIRYGNNYLTAKSLASNGARLPATSKEQAVTWYFSDGALYMYHDNSKLYLNVSNYGVLQLSSAKTSTWAKNGERFSTTGNYYGTTYLTFSGTEWNARNTSAQDLAIEETTTRRSISIEYTYAGNVGGENRSFATFFPLNVDADRNVLSTNTGYIASGSTTIESNQVAGDIRTKLTPMTTYGGIYRSLNAATTFGDGSTLELLTCTKTSGGFVRISDSYNAANTSIHKEISGYTKMTEKDLALSAYAAARANFNALMLNKTQVYGMHFMNAQVSKENVYVAPKAVINGTTYTNYEMTANSIDFRTQSRGHVSFFAGTYYGSDKNFFSLHEIFRDADNHITAVREIAKIYAKTSGGADYIYKYSDGGYSGGYTALPDGYELEFDCAWIIEPTIVRNAVYYFEIPVNRGEYALGSASTGDGAYLMYLDIGANAAGTGETPGGEAAYAMESVDFVNRAETGVERDADGNAVAGSYSSYTAVVAALSDANGTPYIVFRRRDGTDTDASGDISTLLSYRSAGLTVAPTPQTGAAEEDTTLPLPDDIGTG